MLEKASFLRGISVLFGVILYVSQVASQEIISKQYYSEDGLPSDMVYEIAQDKDKFIWLSTEVGVSRFNGSTFENFDFDNGAFKPAIFEFKETKNGKKWFLGGDGSLFFFERKSNSIREFQEFKADAFVSELIQTSKGWLVASSYGDGIRIKDKGIVYHINTENGLLSDRVSYIWEGDSGVYAVSALGISRINDDKSVDICHRFDENINFSRACKLSSGRVILSIQDRDEIFICKEGKVNKLKGSSALTQNVLQQICLLKSGQLVACSNNGIQFFELENDSIVVINELFSGVSVTNIILDHEGSFWLSTLGDGFLSFQEKKFMEVGIREKAFCFLKGRIGEVYIGYEKYLFGTKTAEELVYTKLSHQNLSSNRKIISIYQEDNSLWLVLDAGMASYSSGKTRYYRTLSGGLLFDEKILLMGGKSGYYRLDKSYLLDSLRAESFTVPIPSRYRRLSSKTYCIKKNGNDYLIGTKTGLFIDDGERAVKSTHPILSRAIVNDIVIGENEIAISTFGYGAFVIREKDTIHFTEENGLISNYCQTIYIYDRNLYVGTNKGLTIITNYESDHLGFYSATKQDGLLNESIQDIIADDNEILIATLGGVFSMKENDYIAKNYDVPLFLKELKVNDKKVQLSNAFQFSYEENKFSFEFQTVSFKFPKGLRMYYQLNNSVEWTEFKGDFLEFNALEPGEYELKVKVMVNAKSSKIYSYSFAISPPYWKTWTFIIAVTIGMILIVYWFFKIRVLTYNRDVVRELLLLFVKRMKKEEFIIIKNVSDGSQTKINLNYLLYVKAADNYVEFHSSDRSMICARAKMKDIYTKINDFKKRRFVRCHKSYIVNRKKISGIHNNFIKIDEEKIPIGKFYFDKIEGKDKFLKMNG